MENVEANNLQLLHDTNGPSMPTTYVYSGEARDQFNIILGFFCVSALIALVIGSLVSY